MVGLYHDSALGCLAQVWGKSQSLRSAGIVNLAALELFVQTSSLFQGFHKNDPPVLPPSVQQDKCSGHAKDFPEALKDFVESARRWIWVAISMLQYS